MELLDPRGHRPHPQPRGGAGRHRMMGRFVAALEARDPAAGRWRAYTVEAGRDLFGAWLVEVSFGRTGCRRRTLVYVAADIAHTITVRRAMPEETGHVSIAEAATALGVSPVTIRRKIERGELAAVRDDLGKLWITVPESVDGPHALAPPAPRQDESALIEALREQVGWLRGELERAHAERDRLLALLERTQVGWLERLAELLRHWRRVG